MKKKPILPLVALCLTVMASSGSSQSFLTNGLVAYYPFNGNANDASGNGINGIASAVTQTANRFGGTEGAYLFNSSSSVVTVPGLASTNLSAMTLSAWVKPTGFPSPSGSIINKYAAFTGSQTDYGLMLFSDLRVHFTNVRHGSDHDITTTNSLSLDRWYHVAVTLDSAGTGTIWVNGVLQARGDVFPLVPPASEPVRIGQMVTASGSVADNFIGSIDDVRIYNRALSDSEVQQLYAYESQPSLTTGLVAYYPFDGNADDASGNGKNGVASGVAASTNRFGYTGSAYQFNGSSSVVTIAPLSSTSLSAMTLSAWIRPTAVPPVQGSIMNKWAAFTDSLNDWGLLVYSEMRVHFANYDHVSGAGKEVVSTNSLSLGQWYHIVATVDSAGAGTIWVNGVLQGRASMYRPVPPSAEAVRIGQMVTASGAIVDTFSGSIDDVRIYNRALSAAEVQELYAQESQPPCIPHGATAVAQVVNGFVVGATITDPGCGYTEAPVIKIVGSGTGATATATLSNGSVTEIKITSTGSGYSTNTTFRIASPPSMPWLQIGVSKVNVTMHVTMGKNYIVESSTDMVTWTQVGSQFTADDEVVVQEFAVGQTGCYFRVTQVP